MKQARQRGPKLDGQLWSEARDIGESAEEVAAAAHRDDADHANGGVRAHSGARLPWVVHNGAPWPRRPRPPCEQFSTKAYAAADQKMPYD